MKYFNLGVKDKMTDSPVIASQGSNKSKVRYPSFQITGDDVPDFLDKLEVGDDMVTCQVVLCKTSHSEDKEYGEKRQGFSIYKIAKVDGSKEKLDKATSIHEAIMNSDDED